MLYPAVLLFATSAFGQIISSQPRLTLDQIAGLESAVRANPADRASRMRLLQHYLAAAQGHPDRVAHVLYWVEQFPADPTSSNPLFLVTPGQNANGHEAVRQAWARAIAANPTQSKVLLNAARFLQVDHPEEAERLLADAVGRAPDDRLLATNLGFHYALNLIGLVNGGGLARPDSSHTRALRDQARASLEASRHPIVLGAAGVALPNLFPVTPAAREQKGDRSVFELAARLMARAGELAPDEAALRGPMPLVEEYRAFQTQQQVGTILFREPAPVMSRPAVPDRIRVGGNVMAGKLIHKPEPAYPGLARESRIEGTVRLTLILAKDGTVEALQLISGHPILVPAAVEAARQYRYQPTLLNGQPVSVVTQVDVNFTVQR